MRFETWPAVYLLALVPALLLLYARAFRRQRQALAAFVEQDLAPRVLPWAGGGRRWARALCLTAAAACLIVALMAPHWGRGARTLPLLGRDVIVLLDVSYSMLAEDAEPNRLARAKAAVRSLAQAVQRDGGHRLGLLAFAGRADVLCPLTRDYRLFLKRLEDASVDAVGRRGTSIGEALRKAVRSFGELAPGYTDLVLVSDGEDHGGLPLEAAAMLAGLGLRLHTVGVGDPERSMPIPIADDAAGHAYLVHDGQEVQTRMRNGLLIGMADAADGVNLTLEDGTDRLARLYAEHIAGQPRRELATAGDQELSPRYHYFLLLAAVLLLVEVALRRSQRDAGPGGAAGASGRTLVPARGRVWAGLFAFLPILGADQAAQDVRAGNQLYQAGQYDAALRAYRAAAGALPESAPGSATIEFNQGNALFKNPRRGRGARPLPHRADHRGPGLGGPRQVQHRRDQVPPGAGGGAALRGCLDPDAGGGALFPREPRARSRARGRALQPGARLPLPAPDRGPAAARAAERRAGRRADLAAARSGVLRPDPQRGRRPAALAAQRGAPAPWPARQRDAGELRRQSGAAARDRRPPACRWRWAPTPRVS